MSTTLRIAGFAAALSTLLVVSPASADEPGTMGASAAPPAGEADATPPSVLAPRQIDARASMQTDVTLAYMGIGASVDVGVTKLGPGTLAAGGGLEYDFCWSNCWSTPMDFNQGHLWPQFRGTYHLQLPKVGYLDFYPVVTLGPVFSHANIQLDNTTRYKGSDVAIGVGMGAGANFFLTRSIFVSGEAKVRYAAGSYDYELVNGVDRSFDRTKVGSWSLNGLDAVVALGARF